MPHLAPLYNVVRDFADAQRAVAPINGFLHDLEGYFLYLLARYGEGEGAIVEIGSFEGRSTAWLAMGSLAAGRETVYAIDTFAGSAEHAEGAFAESPTLLAEGTTYHAFRRNIDGLGLADRVEAIRAASLDAAADWDKPIRLLFIDGSHDFASVAADFQAWCGHVVPGGFIAMHDYGHSPDVVKFCDDIVKPMPEYPVYALANSLLVFQYAP